jgi:hypothetical protein
MGGYSETDGVYYDPNKDTLPEGVIINDGGNRVGEYYDYYEVPISFRMQKRIPNKENMILGMIITGIPITMQQIQTGEILQVLKPTITTIPGDGDLLGDGVAGIAHIGV